MFDAHANLALAPVLVPPSPALSGTSLIITGGYASLFPAVPFNCTVYPGGVTPTAANAEIVRVTNITGDVFTITRAQEGTTAKAIASGWQIANTISVKVITDIENAISSMGGIQSISAGTAVATDSQIIFANSNGVSFGVSSNVITASFSGGGGGSGAAISAGANSQNTGTVVFSNSNGVTFGLSNDGMMTASHNAITSQSNQAASASNGSFTFQTIGFSNANGVTFGTSAGSIITASVGTAAAGNSVNFSAGTTSNDVGSIVFSNSNGVSFGLDGSTITAQHNGLTSQSNQAFSASGGSSAFQTLSFANANGITFSNNGGAVEASHNGLTSQSAQAASASNGSFTFQTIGFSNANNVTFGTSAGSIITASVGAAGSINFSAGTTSNNLNSIVFSNSNGVSFGLNGSTVTASVVAGGGGATLTAFVAPELLASSTLVAVTNSDLYCHSFVLPQPISLGYVRFLASMQTFSTTIATIASATATAFGGAYQTMSVRIYSMGSGASIESLYPVISTTAGYSFQNNISVTNSSQHTVTQGMTAFTGSVAYQRTLSYTLNSSVYQLNLTGWSLSHINDRYFDIPFGTSLPAGNYVMMAGRASTASTSGAVSLMANCQIRMGSLVFANQAVFAPQPFGSAQIVNGMPLGAGIYSSTGTNLTAELNQSQVSAIANNAKIYFQMSN